MTSTIHCGVAVSTAQQEGSRIDSQLGPFCEEFSCPVCMVLSGYSIPPSKNMHDGLIGDS